MPDPTPETLLAELETLTHSGRVRRMMAVGRKSQAGDADSGAAASTLAALAADSGFYPRLMALYACYGSRDGAAVTRALTDPSRGIRGLGIALAPLALDSDALREALAAASPVSARDALLRSALRRWRGGDAVDAFLEGLAASGDAGDTGDATSRVRLGPLLAYGSASLARRHLPLVEERLSGGDWARLAHWQPDLTLDALGVRVAAQTQADARLLAHVNAALPFLARNRPDAAVRLVEAALRHESLSRVQIQGLVAERPNAVADLVLASPDASNVDFGAVARQLTPERLLALLRTQPTTLRGENGWFRRLSPDLRRAVWALAGNGWQISEGIVQGIVHRAIVAALPDADLRAGEARRHLALPVLATRTPGRLPYASFLPWDEARATLDPFIRNPDPDLRTAALPALIGAARYDDSRLDDVLTLVHARNNEQDPVRAVMLTALKNLPPSRWLPAHLEGLGQILRDALDAADLSQSTATAAESLVLALVPTHGEWAAGWLATLASERGQIYGADWQNRVSDRDMQYVAPALLPVFQSWETRERERSLVGAASRMGRRLSAFGDCAALLERVAATTRDSWVPSVILGLFQKHLPTRMATLVPTLIADDASVVTLPTVYTYLHRHRQDLLSPFLGDQAYVGRFSTGKTRSVLPVADGFYRWTPTQQARFAQTLTEVTEDPARDTPTLLRVMGQLAALPAVPPTRLIALANLSDTVKPAIRDAALRALSRRDAGDGTPTLISALGDSRARIAIYALRTVLREMPAPQALALLETVPMAKVMVAKEVIRLIGDLEMSDAYAALLRFAAVPPSEMHRDVRVALLRAFWNYPEQDQTWSILDAAATDPDPAVARGVVRLPADRLSLVAQARLRNLLALLLAHPEVRVRTDTLECCFMLPLADPDQVLLPGMIARLGSPLPDESALAARAVFATYAERDPDAVGAAISTILPHRRALLTAIERLISSLLWSNLRLQATARAVLAALEPDPVTATLRVRLALAGLPSDERAPFLTSLAARDASLHADALAAAAAYLSTPPRFRRPELSNELATVEAALTQSDDARLRRLALAALVGQSQQTEGWTPELRERLEGYHEDPSPLVAGAAQFVFPPPVN